MNLSQEFIEYIALHRREILQPEAPSHLLELLGLDDESLQRWRSASETIVTLPHSSPNVFKLRTRVMQHAAYIQTSHHKVHHARITLSHNNYSDLGWRPYSWWFLNRNGEVSEERFVTRHKKFKHLTVSSQPPLHTIPEGLLAHDTMAAEAAVWGSNLSVSFMLIDAVTSHFAGLKPDARCTYIPLNWLISFAQDKARASSVESEWLRFLLDRAEGRSVSSVGKLEAHCSWTADILDNFSNLALLSLLGEPHVLGGEKMAGYWPHPLNAIREANRNSPVSLPFPHLVTVPNFDLLDRYPPSPRVKLYLRNHGLPYSQGLAVAEHGRFAANE